MLLKRVALGLAVFTAVMSVNCAYADENIFGAVQVDDTVITTPPAALPIENNGPMNPGEINYDQQTAKLQDAMIKIDNAQADIINELNAIQSQFAEVDKRYKMVKLERKMTKKQLKLVKKRVKSLEKAKKEIRKNMK